MIDTHVHVVPPGLPGVGSLSLQPEGGAAEVATRLREEMAAAGVDQVLAMGAWNAGPDDPLGVNETLRLARAVPGLYAAGVADPLRTDPDHLRRAEAVLASGQVRALKAYLGYLHYPPDHAGYRPYYELAARFKLPFVFHTGDTYSPSAKVRLAHPLLVDDVAVDHPDVRFVLAHVGNPWLTDAAEVVYKNINVWADLSGLVVGDAASFVAEERQEMLHEAAAALRRAFRYAERPNRFLYGSDWPLAPMTSYRDFIRSSIPEIYHPLVFEDNARLLFRLEGGVQK
ncbi:MAG TPA: amidohydrolase family protein [Gemmataceae bacterium]|nr:amidohydrolase family protein [Gemmataceae bacterium]